MSDSKDSDKKPWETLPDKWKTESAFMSYVRGGIRGALWKRYPIKTEYMKIARTRDINPKTGKECFGAVCYLCGQFYPQKDIEIDHLKGGHSLKTIDDANDFLRGMLYIDFDDMATACRPCHRVKSYAERTDMSFEEAKAEKEAIAIEKKGVAAVKKLIESAGQEPASNSKMRRQQLKSILQRANEEGL